MEVLKNSIEINPLPILSGIKSQKSEKEDYIPQIHPDEQSNYMIYKMNETFTNEEKKKENLNDSYLKTEEKLSNNNVLPYPSDKDNSKKAIKLISVPHEKELLKNQENPQEYQESNLQKVDNEKILEIFDPKDSQILSPNLVNFFCIYEN